MSTSLARYIVATVAIPLAIECVKNVPAACAGSWRLIKYLRMAPAEREEHIAKLAKEHENNEARIAARLRAHEEWRDGDTQHRPYTYEIGRHGNESLALRYGIANCSSREGKIKAPADKIRVQKIRKISESKYEVFLPDFGDRQAIAIIESGAEYVKTFYPRNDSWFKEKKDLEDALKDGKTFSLNKLAEFHVMAAMKA